MLSVIHVNKSYKHNQVLKNLSLCAEANEITCLIGPNGSGKTTLLNLIGCLIKKDSGSITIDTGSDSACIDKDNKKYKSKVSMLVQETYCGLFMTVYESLIVSSGLRGVKLSRHDALELLNTIGLAQKSNYDIRSLSGGMKRRLMFASIISSTMDANNPKVVILDEPTANIDPNLRDSMLLLIKDMAKRNCVIMSTHNFDEVDQIAQKVIMIKDGQVAINTQINKLNSVLGFSMKVTLGGVKVAELPSEFKKGLTCCDINGSAVCMINDSSSFIQRLIAKGIALDNIFIEKVSIEDVYRTKFKDL